MTDRRVGLADTGQSSGTGATWDNDGGADDAFHAKAGFEAAVAASAAGDNVYGKDTISNGTNLTLVGPFTVAALTNPVRCIGVVTGASDTVLKADVLLGHREGNSTKAYAQGGEIPPTIVSTGAADINIDGSLYFYGFIFEAQDNFLIGGVDGAQHQTYEECKFICGTASTDVLRFGTTTSTQETHRFTLINCLFAMDAVALEFLGQCEADFYNCIFTGIEEGFIEGLNFAGNIRFHTCDFTGVDDMVVDISGFHGGTLELWNCRMPLDHILTTGTATGLYKISNYGSEDQTGLTTGGSEQALQIHTHEGTVEIEQTIFRTGGATDLAKGLFAYAVNADNVSDNFCGVEVPLRDIWVEGDGNSKTYTVFISNDTASTDFQDDGVYLRLEFPSAAGISMYDYRPDEGAPGDGGGQTQLLGTPADLDDDVGSVWGTGGNNHQSLSQAISPKYEGVIHGTLIYSRVGGDELYVDVLPVIT